MNVTVIGCGTLVPNDERRGSAYLLEERSLRLLLDCGTGTVHGLDRHGMGWRDLTHVALSHFHVDHCGDVAALLVALKHGVEPRRTLPLTILGPPGLSGFLAALGEAFRTDFTNPGFPLTVVELERAGAWDDARHGLHVSTHPTPHTESSVTWRIQTETSVIGYTGDTGPHPPLASFFRGADTLIAECSFPDPPPMSTHLTPRGVASLGLGADPGVLVLSHLYPSLDPVTVSDRVREAGFHGRIEVAVDGLVIPLPEPR